MAVQFRKTTTARLLALATAAWLGLSACGGNPEQPDTGEEVEDVRGAEDLDDPYDGPFDAEFRTDVEAYAEQEVTLTAEVADVLSPVAFTITAPEGVEGEVEPLLVVATVEPPSLDPGTPVTIAATPRRELEVTGLEDELGTDLDEAVYAEWEGEPYLTASIVEVDQ